MISSVDWIASLLCLRSFFFIATPKNNTELAVKYFDKLPCHLIIPRATSAYFDGLWANLKYFSTWVNFSTSCTLLSPRFNLCFEYWFIRTSCGGLCIMDLQFWQIYKLARVVRSSRAQQHRWFASNELAKIDFRSVFLEIKKTNECEHVDRTLFFVKYHPLVNTEVSA